MEISDSTHTVDGLGSEGGWPLFSKPVSQLGRYKDITNINIEAG